eukprot:gene917-924_t
MTYALLAAYGEHHQPSTNKLDDSIFIRNPVNHHDPYECTNKGLGGTSATWGGRCVMYDEVDFIDRPILNGNCTWDTDLFNETQKYIAKAANYFECGEPLFDLKDISAFSDTKIADNFVNGDVTDTVVERWSMPTRFGDRYKNELAQNKNITLMMGYEARTFSDPDEDGKAVMMPKSQKERSNSQWIRVLIILTSPVHMDMGMPKNLLAR